MRGGGHGFLEFCRAAVEIHAFLPIDHQRAGDVHCLAGSKRLTEHVRGKGVIHASGAFDPEVVIATIQIDI